MGTKGPGSVGVIGLGRVGLPISERLLEMGFAVSASDRVDTAAAALTAAGGQWVSAGPELAATCDVIITVLPGPEEVQALLEPLLDDMRPGATWIDMSTGTPELGRERARAGSERQITILEAPMGGGPEQARSGELLIFAAGQAADLGRQQELLGAVARRVLHVGPSGAGYT